MSESAHELKKQLEDTEVSLRFQRRGRKKLPGVPDSVVWIRPEDPPVPACVPLLFELENKGTFSNAKRDAIEFGKRHNERYRSDNDSYEYTLNWPTIASRRPSSIILPIMYELLGMSTSTVVAAGRDVSERKFHKRIRQYYRENESTIQTKDVRIQRFNDTEVVFWTLEVNIFGSYAREMKVPFFLSFGSDFEDVINHRFPVLSLPMGVCVGGEGADRTKTITRDSGVEFPLFPNVY